MMKGHPLEYSFDDKVNEGITSHDATSIENLNDENSIYAASSIFGFMSFC